MSRIVKCFIGAAMLWLSTAHAGAPDSLHFQGRLLDGSGNPVTVTTNVAYRIYSSPSGPDTLLWGPETHSVTPDGAGHYNVLLGSIVPLPTDLFAGSPRFLGLTVATDPELVPRLTMVSVAYALRAETVDGAAGGTITSKVSIGSGHINTGAGAFVAGDANTASGSNAAVTGGMSNVASGNYSFVGGGRFNKARSDYSVVGGGGGANPADSNVALGHRSTIVGGNQNLASGNNSLIGGGSSNVASGLSATIAGGNSNIADGSFSSVTGGSFNTATGAATFVGAGSLNLATGSHAVVCGGLGDTATGLSSMVPGGTGNRAAGSYALAAGRRAKALHHGAFVWADDTDADFSSSGTDQFLIRASGGVGINTSTPSVALHVAGNAGIIRMEGTDHAFMEFFPDGPATRKGYFGFPGAAIDDIQIANEISTGDIALIPGASGNVGVGTGTPAFKLDVAGAAHATSFPTSSDSRLKKDVRPLSDVLPKLEKIRGVSFDWNETYENMGRSTGRREIGVIAEEVEAVFPELVSRWGEEEYRGVDYGRLTAVLIEAVKELTARVEQLEDEVASARSEGTLTSR